jgi:hypothetical protein
MVIKMMDLYVVAKNAATLLSTEVYDLATATTICCQAKDSGYNTAEVINLAYAIRNRYSV